MLFFSQVVLVGSGFESCRVFRNVIITLILTVTCGLLIFKQNVE